MAALIDEQVLFKKLEIRLLTTRTSLKGVNIILGYGFDSAILCMIGHKAYKCIESYL